MKTKTGKIILCGATLLFSAIAACIGMGLLGSSNLTFGWRILCGCFFIWPPILIISMISTMFKK